VATDRLSIIFAAVADPSRRAILARLADARLGNCHLSYRPADNDGQRARHRTRTEGERS